MSQSGKFQLPKKVYSPVSIIGGERLPISGMSITQALEGAQKWWDSSGRDYFRRIRARPVDGIKHDEELKNESGIFFGKNWEDLNRREKYVVTKMWHRTYCEENFGESTKDPEVIYAEEPDDGLFEGFGFEEEE